jgi:ribosomal protein L11 methyltransferase
MNYFEITFEISPKAPWSDILTAYLAEIGFESFVETESGFQAYIQADLFDENELKSIEILNNPPDGLTLNFDIKHIEAQNWNASWESSFEPVIIGQDLAIVAPFHHDFSATKYVIVIEPKMSFGTGHHQTTRLMSQALFDLELIPKNVLDMGCGTGVLAILAEQLGAQQVLAVDVEIWAYENSIENAQRNGCANIEVQHGDVSNIIGKSFDLILANINKNVLKADMQCYADSLVYGGRLFLSGFFTSDNEELISIAKNCNLALDKSFQDENWSCLTFVKRMA